VLEARSLLSRVAEAVPGADITVVRLRAPRELVRARIVAREAGRDPQWYLDTAAYLFDRLEHAGVEDHVVDNDRPVAQIAADVLHAAGWLGTRSPDRG
jgi:predicted kinase